MSLAKGKTRSYHVWNVTTRLHVDLFNLTTRLHVDLFNVTTRLHVAACHVLPQTYTSRARRITIIYYDALLTERANVSNK